MINVVLENIAAFFGVVSIILFMLHISSFISILMYGHRLLIKEENKALERSSLYATYGIITGILGIGIFIYLAFNSNNAL